MSIFRRRKIQFVSAPVISPDEVTGDSHPLLSANAALTARVNELTAARDSLAARVIELEDARTEALDALNKRNAAPAARNRAAKAILVAAALVKE